MADKKLTEANPGVAATGTDEVVMIQSAGVKKVALKSVAPKLLQTFCSGKPANSEVIGGGIAPRALTIVQANCSAKALVAATGSTTITIKNNGSSIGTIVFSAAGTTGAVTITTAAVSAGDNITYHAPATADGTLADITILLSE